MHWKHNTSGNQIGRYSQNAILDTHLYEMEFPGSEITEMTANIIAELIYAKYDVDGYEYLLLNSFVNLRKDNSTLSL